MISLESVQKKKSEYLFFLFVACLSIGVSLLISTLVMQFSEPRFINSRLLFIFFMVFALIFIVIEVFKWRLYGLFSPLTWSLLGFIVFHFYIPITHPEYWNVYSELANYLSLILVLGMGMVGIIAGYYLVLPDRKLKIRSTSKYDISLSRLSITLSIIWALYILLLFITAKSGGYTFVDYILTNRYLFGGKEKIAEMFSGFGYYSSLFIGYIPMGIFGLTVYCLWEYRFKWFQFILVIGVVISLVYTINAGVRSAFLFLVGGGAFYWILCNIDSSRILSKNNIKRAIYFTVIIGLFFVVAVIQFGIRFQRTNIRDLSIIDIIKSGQTVRSDVYYRNTDQNYTLYQVIEAAEKESLDFLNGESYVLTFVSFIPRRYWENKPGGASMYEKLSRVNPWTSHDNVSYSYLGELIFNFGLWSVLPGSLLFGLVAGAWWKYFLSHRNDIRIQLLYSLSIVSFAFMVRGSFTAMFGRLFYSLILAMVVLFLSKRKIYVINT